MLDDKQADLSVLALQCCDVGLVGRNGRSNTGGADQLPVHQPLRVPHMKEAFPSITKVATNCCTLV